MITKNLQCVASITFFFFPVPLKCICEPVNKTVKYISEKPNMHTCACLEECAAYSHPEGVDSRMVEDHGFSSVSHRWTTQRALDNHTLS